jgi:hypothetical protein
MKRKAAYSAVAVTTLAVTAVCGTSLSADAATSGTYVALGDSYASGPAITPTASGAPSTCMQSAVNYPHLTAAALGLTLTDASCAGATVSDMTQSQASGVPPQFSALSAADTIVTIQVGGDDNNTFVTAILGCGLLDINDPLNIGAPCKAAFGNTFANEIASDAANISAALHQVHTLAPNARVYVVGYPDILPRHGNCWPQMPLTTGDVAYMRGVENDLNTMLSQQASASGATYIDTYDPTIGHDACHPESSRWIEPIIPATDAAPVHPNAAGEATMARIVEIAITG